MRTLLLEARSTVGGTAASEPFAGGTVNVCNCDHITFRTTPVMDDLDLGSFGLRYIEMEPAQVAHGVDGWAAVAAVPRRRADARRARRHPPGRGRRVPPLPPRGAAGGRADPRRRHRAADRRRADPRRTCAGGWPGRRRCCDGAGAARRRSCARSSPTMPCSAPAWSAGPMVWGVSPEQPGTGLGALSYAMRHVGGVGRPAGGSGALTEALRAAFAHHGGELRTEQHRRRRAVRRIPDDGRRPAPTAPRSRRRSSSRHATRSARSSAGCATARPARRR